MERILCFGEEDTSSMKIKIEMEKGSKTFLTLEGDIPGARILEIGPIGIYRNVSVNGECGLSLIKLLCMIEVEE